MHRILYIRFPQGKEADIGDVICLGYFRKVTACRSVGKGKGLRIE